MNRYATLAAFVPFVAAHGFIRSPAPRQPGDAFKAACGEQPFFQQSSDINGNVQGILQVVGNDFDAAACNLWLCKGFQFDDNSANVQSFTLGETIDFDINIAAPHTGIANVSVVKTSTNSIIGTPLIEFENYASNAGVQANNSAFSVTLPSDLSGECTTAGDCVLQWYWDASDINQTYESCVDFTVSGAGNGGSNPPVESEAPASSAAPTAAPTPSGVVTTSLGPAPTPSSNPTTPPDDEEDDEEDDECPIDEDDDEEDDEEPVEDDDECPIDDEDDEEDEEPVEDDDECPIDDEDDEEDDEEPVAENPVESGNSGNNGSAPSVTQKTVEVTQTVVQPTRTAQATKTKNNNNGGQATTFSTIVRVVTVTKAAPTVTVTAPASGECTTA